MFDDNKLIITSANLTKAGLKRNKEYRIFTDNSDLVKTASNNFGQMCKDDIIGKVKSKNLSDIQNLIDSIPKEDKIVLPKYEIENENDEVYSYKIIE